MLRKTQPRGSVSILRKTQFGCTALFVVLQKEEKPKSKTKVGQKERMSKDPLSIRTAGDPCDICMNTEIVWNQDSKTVDLPQSENEFYKGLSEILTTLPVPNRATVSCHYGTAVFDVIKKGGAAFIREDSNIICLPGSAAYPEV